MGILDQINQTIEVDKAEMAATHCKIHTQQTFLMIVDAYLHGIKAFWNSGVEPQLICNKLGTDAKEIFELHYLLGQLIANVKPDIIQNAMSSIGNFTMNEDGTVTIN